MNKTHIVLILYIYLFIIRYY